MRATDLAPGKLESIMTGNTRTVKVHKVEIMIIDHDQLGAEGVRDVIMNQSWPNDCIMPKVVSVESQDVEYYDQHPLNMRLLWRDAYAKLFPGDKRLVMERDKLFIALQQIQEDILNVSKELLKGRKPKGES